MDKRRKQKNALKRDLAELQAGYQEGVELKTDKTKLHTLEDIPDPIDLSALRFEDETTDETTSDEKELKKKKRNVSEKTLEILRQNKAPSWQPGQSGNPNGRPKGTVVPRSKSKDPLREIGRQIAFTNATLALTPKQRKMARSLGYNPNDIQLIEALMLHLATSANPNKIALFLDRTFGKAPNISISTHVSEDLVQRFKQKLTDSELEAIAEGADVFEILLAKLPDVDDHDDYVNAITVTAEDSR